MKRLTLALLILLLSTLVGCTVEKDPGSTWDRETVYTSGTSTEDCYLCGEGIENLASSYWGQENVAFISLNTFEIIPLEIIRYTEIDENLIEEHDGITSFHGSSNVDGGFSVKMMMNYGRRFAGGALEFHNDEILDIDKAATFLCTDCLNEIIQSTLGPYFGVGIIDLETKEIRVLEKRIGGISFKNYYIFCELQEQEKDNPLQMELLILYCPIQYDQ